MNHTDKIMNPQHFGRDPADIHIWINPGIRIQIQDHILTLAEFALSGCSCYYYNCYYYFRQKFIQMYLLHKIK